MGTLYVTEYENMAGSNNGTPPQMVQAPGVAEQTVSFSTTTQSNAFGATTRVVRVHTDAICSIKFGSNPTATTASKRMVAGQTEYFGVKPGDKVAAVTNT